MATQRNTARRSIVPIVPFGPFVPFVIAACVAIGACASDDASPVSGQCSEGESDCVCDETANVCCSPDEVVCEWGCGDPEIWQLCDDSWPCVEVERGCPDAGHESAADDAG